MGISVKSHTKVKAVTHEVLPQMGLAYVVDDSQRTWAVTRTGASDHFEKLAPGQSCHITITDYGLFSLVSQCEVSEH